MVSDVNCRISSARMMRIISTLLLSILASPVLGDSDRLPLFQDDSILKAVVTAPIAQAYAQRKQDVRLYLPGNFVYIEADGNRQRLDASIRALALFRLEY